MHTDIQKVSFYNIEAYSFIKLPNIVCIIKVITTELIDSICDIVTIKTLRVVLIFLARVRDSYGLYKQSILSDIHYTNGFSAIECTMHYRLHIYSSVLIGHS